MSTVRYLLTTLDPQSNGRPIAYPTAELPFTGVSFSLCFNQAGPFSATLNVEDRQVQSASWINATNPGKTFFWVEVDGQLVYGGRILRRTYDQAAQTITITGADFYSYWSQRLQALDYTAHVQNYVGATSQTYAWAAQTADHAAGAPPPMIAWQLLRDAAAVSGSLRNLSVPFHGQGAGAKSDPDYWISNPDGYQTNYVTFSAPLSQQQSVDSLVQQFIGMGYLIGVDVVAPVSRDSNGNPQAQCWVCWPRWGETAAQQAGAGQSMKILDLSTVIDLQWSEDASAQATALVELTGGGGVKAGAKVIDAVALGYNYPLTELAVSHTSTSPTSTTTTKFTSNDTDGVTDGSNTLTGAGAAGAAWTSALVGLGIFIGGVNQWRTVVSAAAHSLTFDGASIAAATGLKYVIVNVISTDTDGVTNATDTLTSAGSTGAAWTSSLVGRSVYIAGSYTNVHGTVVQISEWRTVLSAAAHSLTFSGGGIHGATGLKYVIGGWPPDHSDAAVLATLVHGDRDLYAYPQIAPVVTMPVFAHGTGWALTELPMGMDVGIFNPYERQGIGGLSSLPFPTWNVLATMRLVRADVTIADNGVSTMQLTLNPPPGNPSPPGYE
jgi:hypothetical protein